MSGLLNELDSYREVTRAIATQGRSLRMEKDQETLLMFTPVEMETLERAVSYGLRGKNICLPREMEALERVRKKLVSAITKKGGG